MVEMKKEKKGKKENKNVREDSPELLELLQRTQANFENYQKQTEKRIADIREMAAKDFILQVLPVLDNFELALKNKSNQNEEFIDGIQLIHAQLLGVLENNGIKPIAVEGKFDPYFHEALMKVDSELPENMVVEEFQKGFTLHDKVIRHAKVKISSGKKSVDLEKNKD